MSKKPLVALVALVAVVLVYKLVLAE